MKIILSPAKKMKADPDTLKPLSLPRYLDQASAILSWLRNRTRQELQTLWKCNETIAQENYDRLAHMNLERGLTPAVLAYQGIAYHKGNHRGVKILS